MEDAGGGSSNPAELPVFKRKPPPMKLNRQGTFKQGSNGTVDPVDISQSPRSSRSSSRGIDRSALEQIQRIKLADDLTPEQSEAEIDDETGDQFALSPRSSNGSNSSTPRALPNAKPAMVFKRQGTFVQRRDGQGDQVELSPGIEIKRRLSAESTKILHDTIGDEDEDEYDDDDYEEYDGSVSNADNHQAPMETLESQMDAITEVCITVKDDDAQFAGNAPEHLAETVTNQDSSSVPEADEEQEQDDEYDAAQDTFSTLPATATKISASRKPAATFGHNRKGTFLQNSSGKAVALDMSNRSAQIGSDEILSRDLGSFPDLIHEDDDELENDDGDDRPMVMIPRSPAKRPMMERKGTFIQSKSGTTTAINLGPASSTGTERRKSDHTLNPIADDKTETSTDEVDNQIESNERVRMGSLNSSDTNNSNPMPSSDGSNPPATPNDQQLSQAAAAETEPVLPLSLAEPEPLMQRKATYIQTKSGHTATLVMTSETIAIPVPASIEIIDEEQQETTNEVSDTEPGPLQTAPRANRVDPVKRQAYLKNRKGTFAANENGKMVQVTLGPAGIAADAAGLDRAQISIGDLAEIANEDDEEQSEEDDMREEPSLAPIAADIVPESNPIANVNHHQHDSAPIAESDPNMDNDRLHDGAFPEQELHDVVEKQPVQLPAISSQEEPIEQSPADPPYTTADCNQDQARVPVVDERQRRPSIRKQVQICSEVVVIDSVETERRQPSTSRPTPRHSPDHNIQRMLETAERDRHNRSRQLRRLEKTRSRSHSLQQQSTLPRLMVTSFRTMQQQPQAANGDELREKFMRPTSAERFLQTYRVYSPAPAPKKSPARSKGKVQRRASSVN